MTATSSSMAPLVGEVPELDYPDSDGEPMADNDTQLDLMILLRQSLRRTFADQEVYVTANVFWYPVHGQPGICTAPDLLVAFGRPAGIRRSYRQWEEAGIAPQVVAEVVSPSNTPAVLAQKLAWYDAFGVEEYWVLDPDHCQIAWYQRQPGGALVQQPWDPTVTSPRLGIRWRIDRLKEIPQAGGACLVVPIGPDGVELKTDAQLAHELDIAHIRADAAEAALAALRTRLGEGD